MTSSDGTVSEHPFRNVIREYKPIVYDEIGRYLDTPIDQGVSDLSDNGIELFHRNLNKDYWSRGGKYIRPILLILVAQSMGKTIDDALKPAAAMEVSEDWLLIHDDAEDHSLERRGKPTFHRKYSTELAINTGDALHLLMWKILRDTEHTLGVTKQLRIMDEFYRMLSRTALGQTAELKLIQENVVDLLESDGLYIIDGKTSYYTIAGPMRLGAIVAEEDFSKLQAHVFPILNDFGCALGRAFQIQDDVLDLTSEFAGQKKQNRNDIYEGKRSIILIHLLNHVSPTEKLQLAKILEKSQDEKTQQEVDFVFSLMQQYGSIEYARNRAEENVANAYKIMQKMDFLIQDEPRTKLNIAIDFVLNRDS